MRFNALAHHQSILHARMSLTAAAATALLQSTVASGQCVAAQSEKIVAPDGAAGDRFGHTLAIDGDIMAVGAYRDDDMCPGGGSCNTGSVHIYRKSNGQWTHETELHPDDLAAGDQFGRAVALSGNTLLVGSPLDDDAGSASGSAYVFTFTGGQWTQQAKLTAADAAGGDSFGDAVAIADDIAIIGALLDDHSAGNNAGSAYIFQRFKTTWTQTRKLMAQDAASADNFGNAVALNGDTIVIGAENDDDPVVGRNTGSAYMFTLINGMWMQTEKVTAGNIERDARFGWSVCVLGETAAISALEEDNRGAAYIFMRGNNNLWSMQQRLVSDDLTTFDDFGHSLALGETTLIIGAASDDDACGGTTTCDSGSAYVFEMKAGSWTQVDKLTAADSSSDDEFGYDVAMSGNTVIIGARLNEQMGEDAGAVYEFATDCPVVICPGDIDQDGVVGVGDLFLLIAAWADGPASTADLDGDGVVNVFDLLQLFALWGPCPGS